MSHVPSFASKGSARRNALLASVFAVAVLGGFMAQRIEASRNLARQAQAFATEPAQVRARLLVIGDSTAVGTGASDAAASVAGQLAARSPSLAVDNHARNGARFRDLPAQLDAASGKRYDAILIMAGGADVMHFTLASTLRADIDRVALQAKSMAPLVVIMPSGNMGNAPFFPPPISWAMTSRAQTLHAVVRDEAALRGLAYVNLFKPAVDDPFALEPARYNAADGLHPSDAGYDLWLHELLAQSPLATVLEMGHVTSVPVLAGARASAT